MMPATIHTLADADPALKKKLEEAERATSELPWPDEALPLFAAHEKSLPYPLELLPKLIREAIEDICTYGQMPVPLAANAVLSAASLAAQGLADVARSPSLVSPISLFALVIAESGERKSSADKRANRAIRQWQRNRVAEQQPAHERQVNRRAVWAAKKEGLLGSIKKKAGAHKREDRDGIVELEAAIADLGPCPLVDPLPTLFMEDTNPEAMSIDLANGYPSVSLSSDEGGLVVGGHGMSEDSATRYFALQNRLWDGNPFTRRRTTRESVTVAGRRLTVNLMMQAAVMSKLLSAGDGIGRATGFLARFLLAQPDSTMGTRLYKEGTLETAALAQWDNRLVELLEMPLPIDPDASEPMALKPPVLHLTPEAFAIWKQLFNDIEVELGASGELSDLTDFGSKAAEQAARIAGVLHVFTNGPYGQIGADLMRCGVELATWHLREARRIFAMIGRSGVATDADVLAKWVAEQDEPVPLTRILQYGPHRTRTKERRDAAITKLTEHGLARGEKRGRADVLALRPVERRAP